MEYPDECRRSTLHNFSLSPSEYYCNLHQQYVDEDECRELCHLEQEDYETAPEDVPNREDD